MKTLNFNKAKKQYLAVTLADEKNTTILVGTPTKSILDDFLALKTHVESLGDEEVDQETLDDLFEVVAKCMSRNKTGYHVTAEFISNIFDVEDIVIFMTAYAEFLDEVTKAKNC